MQKLHAAALTSMKGEVLELQNQVRRLTLEYRPLTSSPSACMGQGHSRQQVSACESRLGPADFEERLEQLTARYEERIIELHSVIAELRKKVERHQIGVIREEDEFEESDQGQSTHNSDGGSLRDENIEISQEFSRVVSEIQPTMDRKPLPPGDLGAGLMSESYQAQIKAETDHVKREKSIERDCKEEEPPEAEDQAGGEKLPELPPRLARPSSLTRSCSSTFPSDPAVRLEVATLRAHNDELLRQTSEVTALRAHNDDLSRRGSALEAELTQMSQLMEAEQRKKEELAQQVMSLQRRLERLQSQQANADVLVSPTHSPAKLTPTPPPLSDVRAAEGESYPVAKMAELKKLKTCAGDSQVLGSEVVMMGNTSTAEHLVQALHQVSGVAELLKTAPGSRGGPGNQQAGGTEQINAAVVAEFEVELERRQARCDHLKAQNDVLSATLEESRSYAERLSVLMGKYESNNTALQLASAFSDHCLEAQDVLTALLDTEMGVLLANCRAAGLGALAGGAGHDCDDQQEVTSTLHRAHHARRKAESVAAHLLTRLDRGGGGGMSGSGHGVGGAGGGSAGNPWEDVSTNSRTASTSSTSSSTEAQHGEFTKEEEARLRDHIQQLKAERSAVRTTVLEIESVHMDPVVSEPRRRLEAQRLDLENAVLVQELMAVKEEKAELKAGSYLLEKETKALELRLVGHEAQESALRLQVDHLHGEIQHLQQQQHDDTVIPTTPRSPSKQGLSSSPSLGVMAKKSKISGNSPSSTLSSSSSSSDLATTKSPGELARDLAVAKAREATLKSRVSELLSALEKISRNSEMRHRQSSEFVGDLKRANAALISAFDRAKRKYQSRLKKMEGQLRVLRDGGGGGGESSSGGGSRVSAGGSRSGGVVVMRQPPPPPDETSL
ncbi:colorectal mutant cancer protein [Elysia marginata]|uniref:Colorectal mutant cancer protein n=1 Tax=Elysia marginata TaxID=1093978 RepID=A0AAV4JZT9_9GAST|nr:colorectal mutant cancer protein [Elysia marginata]